MAMRIDKSLNIWINNKLVYFTIHVRDELDEYGKDTLFACNVIDKGKKQLVSKKENRHESKLPIGGDVWTAVWFDMGDKILVKHFGKEKR